MVVKDLQKPLKEVHRSAAVNKKIRFAFPPENNFNHHLLFVRKAPAAGSCTSEQKPRREGVCV